MGYFDNEEITRSSKTPQQAMGQFDKEAIVTSFKNPQQNQNENNRDNNIHTLHVDPQ